MRRDDELQGLLASARAALAGGDAADAERRAKAITAIVRAERDVAEFLATPPAASTEENEEALRAEIRSRLRRIAEAEHGRSRLGEHEPEKSEGASQ